MRSTPSSRVGMAHANIYPQLFDRDSEWHLTLRGMMICRHVVQHEARPSPRLTTTRNNSDAEAWVLVQDEPALIASSHARGILIGGALLHRGLRPAFHLPAYPRSRRT